MSVDVLNADRWFEAWSRSFVPQERPHLRRRLALNDFFAALHYSVLDRDYARLDHVGTGTVRRYQRRQTLPDAHGRWSYANQTVPFWVYCDSVRYPFRNLFTTVERHQAVLRAAERDVIVLVMVNDNRKRHLHHRWADLAATSSAALPPVAATSYRKLRAWPTGAIWWPLAHYDGPALALHHLADSTRWSDPGSAARDCCRTACGHDSAAVRFRPDR